MEQTTEHRIGHILAEAAEQSMPAVDREDTPQMWTVQERWLLTEGVEVTREVAQVPAELHIGDLNAYSAAAEAQLVALRDSGRCLRIITDHSRIFLALPDRVLGVYVELLTPFGDVAEYLHPGYYRAVDPVADVADDEPEAK